MSRKYKNVNTNANKTLAVQKMYPKGGKYSNNSREKKRRSIKVLFKEAKAIYEKMDSFCLIRLIFTV